MESKPTFCKRSNSVHLMPPVSRPRFSNSNFKSVTRKSDNFLPVTSFDILFLFSLLFTMSIRAFIYWIISRQLRLWPNRTRITCVCFDMHENRCSTFDCSCDTEIEYGRIFRQKKLLYICVAIVLRCLVVVPGRIRFQVLFSNSRWERAGFGFGEMRGFWNEMVDGADGCDINMK